MKNQWKAVRLGLLLFALPLVATAAASGHQWMTETAPISIEMQSTEADAISSARVHTVALNRNGVVEGRIAAINAETNQPVGLSDLKIFFVQNGEVVKESLTEKDGTFAVADIAEGAYSFIATGENGFAAYGVRVITDTTGTHENIMEAAAVSPKFSAVRSILNDKLPAKVATEIMNSESSSDRIVGSNRVRLNDGSLVGHVVPMFGKVDSVEGTYVHILRDDKQVAEVQADEKGSFMVSDLEPGVYDFVAAGPSGFAAVSFQAVDGEAASVEVPATVEAGSIADVVDSEELPVSFGPIAEPIAYQDSIPADIPFDAGYSNSLDVCLTCQGDNMVVGEQLGFAGETYSQPAYDLDYSAPIEYAGESIGCGCASGGSCGAVADYSGYNACSTGCNPCGGGSVGGARGGLLGGGRLGGLLGAGGGGLAGGGLGRLALLGGLAVGITAIADDNNPQPSTPINP